MKEGLGDWIAVFFKEGIEDLQSYYKEVFETFPRDGKPIFEDVPPAELPKKMQTQPDAATKEIHHGSTVVEIKCSYFAEDPFRSVKKARLFKTQSWLFAESRDFQKILAFASGKQEEFKQEVPEAFGGEAVSAYNAKTLEDVGQLLQSTQKKISSFLEDTDEGKNIQSAFDGEIKKAQKDLLAQMENTFGQESYWDVLQQSLQGCLVQPSHI